VVATFTSCLFVLQSNLENLIRFPTHTSLQKQTMNIEIIFIFKVFNFPQQTSKALTHNMLRWYSFITSLFEGDVGGFLFHPVDKMQHIVVLLIKKKLSMFEQPLEKLFVLQIKCMQMRIITLIRENYER
jgi:hypothetical protein